MKKTTWGKVPFNIHKTNCIKAHATICGRDLWALECLMTAGPIGCTPLNHPSPRWSAYVFDLREMGIEIGTVTEPHGLPFPGAHARCVLKSQVVRAEGGCA